VEGELPINAPIGTVRDPRRVFWWSLTTLGVYNLVWFYRFGREVEAAGRFGLDPKRWYRQIGILAALVVTLPVALAHFFVYAFHVSRATEALARRANETTVDVEGRFPLFIVPLAGSVYHMWLQASANKVWARLEARRRDRARVVEAAQEARRERTPVEQLIQCPECQHVITVRYLPGQTTRVKCSSCGFEAPFG
jgi:predicted RNA-binding Zn-ribbon protein involved in translation (DUF1610 family)